MKSNEYVVIWVIVLCTFSQKGCMCGQSHQIWRREPTLDLHLQHGGEIVGWNMCIRSGVRYHLEYNLQLFSCAEMLINPLWIVEWSSFYHLWLTVLDLWLILPKRSEHTVNTKCLWGLVLEHSASRGC